MTKCNECRGGVLKVIGLDSYGDGIEVQCQNPECGAEYPLEADGLGMGGMEWVEAMMLEVGLEGEM